MKSLSQLESLLFVAGEQGLRLEEIMSLLGVYESRAQYLLALLKDKYASDENSGLCLVKQGEHYLLLTKAENEGLVKAYAQSPFSSQLSKAALETLAIIAYEQPITRLKIEDIRGVQTQGLLQKLQLHDLIEEVGREESPGRPILYGVTAYFYNYFGLASLEELPEIKREGLSLDTSPEEKR